MRKITDEELKTILENHKHYLNKDCKGWENMGANLSGVDLRYTDLSNADLREADLSCADLSGSDLSNANLRDADLICSHLSDADLSDANLRDAYLGYANLGYANLRGANLSGASLSCADLSGSDLKCANFKHANLSCADLRFADLSNANFKHANLSCADLKNTNLCCAKNIPFIPMACPEVGAFIGYKKVKDGIVELKILKSAKRSSARGRKCRCNKAKVLGIYDVNKNLLDITETVSNYDPNFVYKVGEVVEEPNFYKDRWVEDAEGIHFFMSFYEAAKY